MAFVSSWLVAFWEILRESGVWLIVGFVLAGVVHAFVPMGVVARHLSGRGVGPVLKAALLGIPLPLCSCSVIPAAAGLRRGGASKGAAAAFAISTPETGEESIALTWGLLGPVFALTRPVAAVFTAVVAGVLIDAGVRKDEEEKEDTGGTPVPLEEEEEEGDTGRMPVPQDCGCCSPTDPRAQIAEAGRKPGLVAKVRDAVWFGLVEMPRDLAPWLVGGLVLSALIAVVVPEGWIAGAIGVGLLPMLAMLLVGLPMYVCATASTPVAAALVAKGLSPGAAMVFLLAGPATNMATMAWVAKDLGWRSLGVYLAVIAAVAVAVGVVFDAVMPAGWVVPVVEAGHEHASVWTEVFAVALAVLLGAGLVGRVATLCAGGGRCR